MCFSAAASFATSSVLVAGGGVIAAQKLTRQERLLAAIPWLFAVQQAIEGVQWVLVQRGGSSTLLGFGFLFFAFLLWPTYIPLAVYMLEQDDRRRWWLRVFLGVGIVGSVYLLLALLLQPLSLSTVERSIQYEIAIPYSSIGIFAYAVVVCGSLLIASGTFLRWFGVLTSVAFFVSYLFYRYTLTSVWCFFAAALSVILVLHFLRVRRRSSSRRSINTNIRGFHGCIRAQRTEM